MTPTPQPDRLTGKQRYKIRSDIFLKPTHPAGVAVYAHAADAEGDMVAMRLFLERIAPASKSRRIKLDLPSLETAADCLKAQGVITAAMATGEISPDEAGTAASVVELKRRAIETVEYEKRIEALEKARGINDQH